MPKILIIDDEKDYLDILKDLLSAYRPDYQVLTAKSGKEGLKLAEINKPDVILLDVKMPEMDGYQVCRHLKQHEKLKLIPVVFLTGVRIDPEDRIKGLDIGGDAYLFKPVDTGELIAQIDVMLRIKKVEAELRREKEALERKIRERTEDLERYRSEIISQGPRIPIKMGIRKRIFTGFGIVGLLLASAIIITLISISILNTNIQMTHDHPLAVTRAATLIEFEIVEMHRSMKDVTLAEGKEAQSRYIDLVNVDEAEVLELFDLIQKQILGEKGQELASITQKAFLEWRPIRQRVIDLTEVGEQLEAQHITQTVGHNYVEFLIVEVEKLVEYAGNKALALNTKSSDIANRTWATTLITLSLSLLMGTLFTASFSRDLTGRLASINNAALKMTGGDIDQVIKIKGNDELTHVANSFNIMANQLFLSYESLEEKIEQRTWELKESEQRLAGFMDSATDGFILMDSELNYLTINRAGTNIVGLNQKEFIGKNILDVVPDIKESGRYAKYQEVLKTGKTFHVSDLIPNPKFGNKYIELKAFKVGDGLGMIFTDITERKQAEQSLRESEEKYRLIVENANDGIEITQDDRIIFSNPRFAEILGYTIDELKNISFDQIFTEEATRDLFKRQKKREAGTLDSNQYETTFRNKAGNIIDVDINYEIIDYQGKPATFAIIRDITEIKQAEQSKKETEKKYRELVEKAGIAILIDDDKGNFKYLNNRFAELFGYTQKEILKLSITQLVYPEDVERVMTIHDDRILGKRTKARYEFRGIRKDQSIIHLEVSVTTLKEQDSIIGTRSYLWDITERKKAEDEIKLMNEIFHDAENAGEVGSWNWIVDTNQVQWSDNLCRIHGLEPGEFDGTFAMAASFYHPDDEERVQETTHQMLDTKKPFHLEYRIITKDGIEKYLLGNQKIIFNKNGDIIRLGGLLKDITERKQVEEALIESEEKLSTILQKSPIPTAVGATEGSIISFNEALEKLIGYKQSEIKNIEDWARKLYPDKKYRDFVQKNIGQALVGEKQDCTIFTITCKNGSKKIVDFHTSFFGGGLIIQMVDITEKKKVEEDFENIFNISPDMLAVCTTEGKFLKVNPSWEEVLGYKVEEMLKLGWAYFVHPDDAERTSAEVQKQLKGNPVVNFVNRFKCKDGSYKTLEWQATYAVEGTVHASARDVTQRQQHEQAIKKSRDQLRRLSRKIESVREEERSKLAGDIHDDLGQSLTALKIDLSLLGKKIPAADKVGHEKINGMEKLINNLTRSVQRISSELRPGLLDNLGLIPAIEWYLDEFEKRTEIKCELVQNISKVELNKDQSTMVFRIFQEALTNVSRHAKATLIKIVLEEEGGTVFMTISDNGRGITKRETEAANSLGLVGMRERLFPYQGTLDLKGSKGKGTAIKVSFPIEILPT